MQKNEKLNVEELDIEMGQDVEEMGQDVEEMTEEQQREFYIEQLKKMKMRFNPIKTVGNKTTNSFGSKYKQKRKQKNKQARVSRKANRKK